MSQTLIAPGAVLGDRDVLVLQFALKQQSVRCVTGEDTLPEGSSEFHVHLCSSEADKFISNPVIFSANRL